MSDSRSCYDCMYQSIQETSHEWIDCFCQKQNNKQVSIQWGCPLYQEAPTQEEKIEYLYNTLKNADWESHWPPTPKDKFIHQIMHDVTKYLVENQIEIKKED